MIYKKGWACYDLPFVYFVSICSVIFHFNHQVLSMFMFIITLVLIFDPFVPCLETTALFPPPHQRLSSTKLIQSCHVQRNVTSPRVAEPNSSDAEGNCSGWAYDRTLPLAEAKPRALRQLDLVGLCWTYNTYKYIRYIY